MDFRSLLAVLAVVGLVACGDAAETPEATVEETPRPSVEYEGEPTVDPGVTAGAIMMDTSTAPAADTTP